MLTPPADFPPAADIIDAVKEFGWDRQRVEQFLETASTYSAPSPRIFVRSAKEHPARSREAARRTFPSSYRTTASGSLKRATTVRRCRSDWLPESML